jgi:succinate dehydrogenase/fumarate reductase flavoprotein subunit
MPAVPILMPHTVTEVAAGIRERKPTATARRRSAAGAVTLATPAQVVAGVIAHRVRVAGAVAAVEEDGEVVVVEAALVVAAGGSECV